MPHFKLCYRIVGYIISTDNHLGNQSKYESLYVKFVIVWLVLLRPHITSNNYFTSVTILVSIVPYKS